MESTATIATARLIAASITAPRFAGRAAVLRLAEGGDASALAALEMSASQRLHAAMRGELSGRVAQAVEREALSARDVLVAKRARDREISAKTLLGEIELRQPGQALRRCVDLAFQRALYTAGFRCARHGHVENLDYVDRGSECGSSMTGSLWPSEVGLANSYGWRVTTSDHHWQYSADILRVPEAERAAVGVLYLSPTVRVRQGRGTSLVMERRTGSRGGWA